MIFVKTAVFFSLVYSCGCQVDHTGKQERWTILGMGRELMADIIVKVKQTVAIRKEHSRFMSYEVGFVIGQIREKYKLMMELYRVCYNRIKYRMTVGTPKIARYETVYYFRKQEYVQSLAMEIDRLVEVLEKTNIDVVPFPTFLEGHILRMNEEKENESEEKKQTQLEEAVKSRYREEWLLRKMNSSGHTTRKRFVDKWPVPGTWSVETY